MSEPHPPRRARHFRLTRTLWHRTLAALVSTGLILSMAVVVARPVEPVEAAWTSEQRAAGGAVSAGTLATPGVMTCTTTGGLLGLGSSVNLKWGESPGADRYQLFGRKLGDNTWTAAGEPLTGIEVTLGVGLLGGLLQGLVDTLLGGSTGTVELRVQAHIGNNWVSTATNHVTVRKSRNLLLVVSYACV